MSTPPRIELRGITKRFGTGAHRTTAVAPIDLDVDEETVLGIIGESGSGKSTLSRMIVGLERPTEGTIALNGVPLADLLASSSGRRRFRRDVQYVGQDTTSSFDPRQTLRRAVATPLRQLHGLRNRTEIDSRLEWIATELDLDPALYDRLPHQVSGGQRQRFALARCLVVEPRLLLCDEVVSALDVSVQGQVLNLIKSYVARHRTGLVFVSHGLPATTFLVDDVLVMRAGAVVERAAVGDLVARPAHPYTRALVHAYRGVA